MNPSHNIWKTAAVVAFALVAAAGSADVADAASKSKKAKKQSGTQATQQKSMKTAPDMSSMESAPPDLSSHVRPQGTAKPMAYDSKPGPAFRTIGGTVNKIEGDMYVVQDYEGNEVRLVVGNGTKKLRGSKKVGDTIRAEITRGHYANSIQ